MDVANQSFTKQKINTNNAHAQAISNVEKASINRIGQRTALASTSWIHLIARRRQWLNMSSVG